MNMNANQRRLEQLLSFGVALVTVFITPWFSYDPLNVSRMLLLTVLSSIAFFLIFPQLRFSKLRPNRFLFSLLFLFIAHMLLVLAFAPGDKWQQFFGAGGRQTGFLTYLCLAILLLSAAISASSNLYQKVFKALMAAGSISIFYGLIQSAGLDPIGWTNPYSPVFGFFGNPNFQASFLGFSAAAVTVFILSKGTGILWRALSGVFVVLALYVIYQSKSQQGFLVYGIGVSIAIIVLFFKVKNLYKFRFVILGGAVLGFIGVFLDILQKSPWSSILYKPSVSYRGDYWRAGWKMTTEHPVFGVGLDSYRDWFFRNRDLVTASRPESSNYTDSAHNVFLDFSANGGLPLLIICLGLVVLTVVSAAKILKRMQGFDPYIVAIFIVWVGYLAQSLISINQIGLAVWGWLTSGLIIGYEVKTRSQVELKRNIQPKTEKSQHEAGLSLRIGAGLVTGLVFGLPAFLADASFRSSIDSRNIERITATADKWPQDVIRMNYISRLFLQNKLPDKALEIARKSVTVAPDNFQAWKILYELPNVPSTEKAQALKMMKKLNPLATDF
jgi:O-antigen ligase